MRRLQDEEEHRGRESDLPEDPASLGPSFLPPAVRQENGPAGIHWVGPEAPNVDSQRREGFGGSRLVPVRCFSDRDSRRRKLEAEHLLDPASPNVRRPDAQHPLRGRAGIEDAVVRVEQNDSEVLLGDRRGFRTAVPSAPT